jgi:hypothetical protein
MNLIVTLYTALLFFILTPNVLLRLPSKGSKMMVALVHSLVFALIFHFTHKFVWRFSVGLEGATSGPIPPSKAPVKKAPAPKAPAPKGPAPKGPLIKNSAPKGPVPATS